jgi:hypothetical protein
MAMVGLSILPLAAALFVLGVAATAASMTWNAVVGRMEANRP